MSPIIGEPDKKAGVFYALTDDGIELPVIDITHEAFALEVHTDEQGALAEALRVEMKEAAKTPPEVVRAAAETSIIMRGLIEAGRGILGGMTSYLLRLGPDNLGKGYASPIDYRIVSGFNAVTMRLRLQDTARSLAGGLHPLLTESPTRPVHLVNIGGGAAPDSINALILLIREHQLQLLAGHPVTICVFDNDRVGPAFGSRAVEVLRSAEAPLHGVDVVLKHEKYDWNDTAPLVSYLASLVTEEPIVAVSSEGGLFEYGSDETIRNNLEVLAAHTPEDACLVATVIRDGELPSQLIGASSLTVRIIPRDVLSSLAKASGWTAEILPGQNLMYEVVRLKKSTKRST